MTGGWRAGAAVSALVAAVFAGLAGCSKAPCETTVLSDVTAPGRPLRAVMFERRCGAERSTEVALLIPDQKPEGGNVFIADAGRGGASPRARLRWDDPHHLAIQYARGAHVALARRQFMSVHTDFVAVDAPTP